MRQSDVRRWRWVTTTGGTGPWCEDPRDVKYLFRRVEDMVSHFSTHQIQAELVSGQRVIFKAKA